MSGTPQETRADYARSRLPDQGATVASVEDGSPAWEVGLEPGMVILKVNGVPLDDIITWRWESADDTCDITVYDPADKSVTDGTMYREPGQRWGVEFTDVLFDGIRTCVNACQFCFMAMLPPGARATLSLRDDDYRLSFLQGNFVTLTNLTDEDVERIIRCDMEPMNVSLHAVSHEVRRNLMGKNEARGLEVLERLLDAGIEVHAQVVLCPGINDGEELERTLAWVEARPNITSIALVPLGYTKYSRRFSESYSDNPESAAEVIRIIEPYQRRARQQRGITCFQLSDEFYVAARKPVPAAEFYDGYPQFYDGIGMLRSFLDEIADVRGRDGAACACANALEDARMRALVVCGEAAIDTVRELVAVPELLGLVDAQAIRNDYYGGDVNVTGLIVACDLMAQLPERLDDMLVVLPESMFNFDSITLDDVSLDEISARIGERGGTVCVARTSPSALCVGISGAVRGSEV